MKNYQAKLKSLAEILASDEAQPEEEIKDLMDELDLNYSEDQIERLNQVLLALHELKKSKNLKANQENHH